MSGNPFEQTMSEIMDKKVVTIGDDDTVCGLFDGPHQPVTFILRPLAFGDVRRNRPRPQYGAFLIG